MRRLTSHPWLQRAIIHPFVFAVFPVLSFYGHNMGKGYLGETVKTTIAILAVSGLLWLIINLFVKNWAKSAIVTSLFFFLFFSFGHAIRTTTVIVERLQTLDKAGLLVDGMPGYFLWLAIWGSLLITTSYFVIKSRNDLRTATKSLNVVALALLIIVGVDVAAGGVNTFVMPLIGTRQEQAEAIPNTDDSSASSSERVATEEDGISVDQALARSFIGSWQEDLLAESESLVADSLPDVYYIILDMYARADFLEETYGIDSSDFLAFLAEKGFYVADRSRANYPYTLLSLASSLNFMYLDEVATQVGERSTNYWPAIVMIRNNRLFHYMRNQGYSVLAFSSGYGISELKDADVYMAPTGWRPTQFQHILMGNTPLAILRKTQDDVRRELVTYVFDHLADATQIDSPNLVFAHIPTPHYPFVFGADGEAVRSKPEFDYPYDEFIEVYGNQLKFITKKAQIAIEEILDNSPTPPIIILQSDHGPNSAVYRGEFVDLPEKFSILNAYYFPDQDYEALSEGITPVNTFRIVLNQYFGANYELLENRSYFSHYSKAPYSFNDVTDEVTAHD